MDTKVCFWPEHPLFRLILQYAFDPEERHALRLISGVWIGEEHDYAYCGKAAAKNDWLEVLKVLYKDEPVPGLGRTDEYTTLQISATHGSLDCLEWLCERSRKRGGTSLNMVLSAAAESNRVQSMRILEKYGATYTVHSTHYWTRVACRGRRSLRTYLRQNSQYFREHGLFAFYP